MKFVLSISGGGIRGIIPAVLLAEFEKRLGVPIATVFDLIAGTSTGGIIATMLTCPGKNHKPKYKTTQILELYKEFGKEVFKTNPVRVTATLGGLIGTKYSCKTIETLLKRYLENCRLSESITKLLIPAYQISGKPHPYFFKTTYAHCPTCEEDNPYLWQCARATSAANGYFKPYRLSDDITLLDGGIFANNPAMCAYAQAKRIFPENENIVIVSLETGENLIGYTYKKIANWGILQWALPFLKQTSISATESIDYMLKTLCTKGDRYFKFQTSLDECSIQMDDAGSDNIKRLENVAHKLIALENEKINHVVSLIKKQKHSAR